MRLIDADKFKQQIATTIKKVNTNIINKIRRNLTPHYLIIGHYTGKIIGCTCGKSGKEEVLNEEPLSTFKRVSKRKCPACRKF